MSTPTPEDKKPAPAPPRPPPTTPKPPAPVPAAASSARPDVIPVAVVYFDRPIQFPGRPQDQHAKTQSTNGESWRVDYLPGMRHFRIVFESTPRPERNKVGYVPIERVLSWEPVQ